MICDPERRQVIDLLPDREPATVEAWLRAHPDIHIVARDRNGGYGWATARALPDAIQVANRAPIRECKRRVPGRRAEGQPGPRVAMSPTAPATPDLERNSANRCRAGDS